MLDGTGLLIAVRQFALCGSKTLSNLCIYSKEDRQCTYNESIRRFRAIIVAVYMQ